MMVTCCYCRDTEEFVAPFLRCLSHPNIGVVKTALHNMAEFIVLARGVCHVLMSFNFFERWEMICLILLCTVGFYIFGSASFCYLLFGFFYYYFEAC